MNLKELKRKQILTITTIALILISFTVIVASVLNIKAFANTGDDINAELNSCQHTFGNWYVGSNKLHARDCTKCGATESDSHAASWGSWAENTISNRHERNCTVSSCTIKEDHAPVDTNSDGKCDTCGFTMGTSGGSTHTHSFTNNWETKTDGNHYLCCDDSTCSSTSKSHSPSWGSWTENTISNRHERYCTESGCTIRDWDNEHAPADENNDGKCDICGFTMGTSGGSTHTHTFTNKWVINADGKHCLMCDTAGCTQVKESHIASWTGNSCTANRICAICGISDGQTLGHNWQAATCTEPETCSRCQEMRGTALGHDWEIATCTKAKTCKRCQATEGTALGHDWQAATCIKPKTCSRCQATEGTALGHDWQAATCTEPETCSRCQEMRGTALGHDWEIATCTKAKTCKRCQATEGTALGHDWQAATCIKPKTCSRCQATEGSELGHDFENWTDNRDGTHKGICSRCQEEKIEEHNYDSTNVCTKCNAVKQSTTCEHDWQIDKAGASETQHWEKCIKCQEKRNIVNHTFVNGVCTVCGYVCTHGSTTVKKDETYHWKECNNCGEQIEKETHKYENGTCSCGKNENVTTPCKHTNREWKADNNYHWQVCKDCGKVLVETTASHVFVNGKCKNCGVAEKSNTSNVKLPNTGGIMKVALITLAISAICGTSYIGFRKYKDIR